MNIEIRSDGTARLTSAMGAVAHVLSGRKYTEVVCRESNIPDYSDSLADTVTRTPRMVFSRHEILAAMRTMPELYAAVVAAYQQHIELNIWWNSSNEINLNDADCIAWVQTLGITPEMINQLRAIIEGVSA